MIPSEKEEITMNDLSAGGRLIRLSLPVMLALLIQSVYNIADSYFVARYSSDGLAALSLIYPLQLFMTALATGTGCGLGILVSRLDGQGAVRQMAGQSGQKARPPVDPAADLMASGLFLGALNFIIFASSALAGIGGYFLISSGQEAVRESGMAYGRIVFLFSLGLFAEANATKLLQARGNTFLPMCAQAAGALLNIALDPILIFGYFGLPAMGIRGAAVATVIGQWLAMAIVLFPVLCSFPVLKGRIRFKCCLDIYRTGFPAIAMQSLNTLYIVGLNLVLKQFSESAVLVLGIYYKLQTFFFIPLMGLQQVILPLVSFHHGAGQKKEERRVLSCAVRLSLGVMTAALMVFMAVPEGLLSIFSTEEAVLSIGRSGLRIIALSFPFAAIGMMYTVYFQAAGRGGASLAVSIFRQVVLLVPLAWLFHFKGLFFVWFTFPATEILVVLACLRLGAGRRGTKAGGAAAGHLARRPRLRAQSLAAKCKCLFCRTP